MVWAATQRQAPQAAPSPAQQKKFHLELQRLPLARRSAQQLGDRPPDGNLAAAWRTGKGKGRRGSPAQSVYCPVMCSTAALPLLLRQEMAQAAVPVFGSRAVSATAAPMRQHLRLGWG